MRITNTVYIFFTLILMFSCKNKNRFTVGSFIQQNNLENPKIKLNQEIESHIFLNRDFEEKSLLLVIKEDDTLYSKIGYYYELLKTNVFKKQENYFIRFSHYDNYFIENINDAIKMYSFYKIDTNKNKLIPIKSMRKGQIIDAFKRQYNISNPLKIIVEERTIVYEKNGNVFLGNAVFIDTLKGKVYLGNAIFSIKDSINAIGFFPAKKKTFYIHYNYSLIDDKIVYRELIGSSSNKSNNFKIYAKTYSTYDKFYNPKKANKYEIFVLNNDSMQKILKTIDEKDVFRLNSKKERELNAGVIQDFRPDFFKYKGEYFFTSFLPYGDEFMEGYPSLYHLDTIQWEMTLVKSLPKISGVKITKMNGEQPIELLTGDTKKRVSYFLDNFEVIKVDNSFKLIHKK